MKDKFAAALLVLTIAAALAGCESGGGKLTPQEQAAFQAKPKWTGPVNGAAVGKAMSDWAKNHPYPPPGATTGNAPNSSDRG